MKSILQNQFLSKFFQVIFALSQLGIISLVSSKEIGVSLIIVVLALEIIMFFLFSNNGEILTGNFLFLIWSQISLLILYALLNINDLWIVFVSMGSVYLGDFLSFFMNRYLPGKKYKLIADVKSLNSTLVYGSGVLLTIILAGFSKNIFTGIWKVDFYFMTVAVLISFIVVLFEVLSSKEFDKFLVPLIIAFFLYSLVKSPNSEFLNNIITGILFAGVVAFISYKVKFLTFDGAIATFLLAGFIFGLGGLKWSAPMLAFFILSSLLSKLRKNINVKVEETYFEKTGVRDYKQVLANGGIGGILVLLNSISNAEIYYVIYLASLAAVCADTWATEIGTWSKTDTYNILNLKKITQGVSGGISARGTLGSLLGAFVIALSGLGWIGLNIVDYFLLIIFAGVFGSLFDSFLGATIQAQHQCVVCDKVTEKIIHCGENARHFQGYIWINNDMVNLLSGFAGALIILLFKSLVNL